MGWTFLYLMVFLKLPIVALFGICWWALRDQPEPELHPSDDGGSKHPPVVHPPHPRRPFPRRPTPRRGPHGGSAHLSPPRVRTVAARARQLER